MTVVDSSWVVGHYFCGIWLSIFLGCVFLWNYSLRACFQENPNLVAVLEKRRAGCFGLIMQSSLSEKVQESWVITPKTGWSTNLLLLLVIPLNIHVSHGVNGLSQHTASENHSWKEVLLQCSCPCLSGGLRDSESGDSEDPFPHTVWVQTILSQVLAPELELQLLPGLKVSLWPSQEVDLVV